MEVESERLNSGTRNGNTGPINKIRQITQLRHGAERQSKGEAQRLIGQKAVKVDGQIVSDVDFEFQGGVHRLVEVGKTRIAQASGE